MHTQQGVTLMIIQNELTVFKLQSTLKDFVLYYAATFIVTCRNGRHGGVYLCQPEYCGLVQMKFRPYYY